MKTSELIEAIIGRSGDVRTQLYIDGTWVDAVSGKTFDAEDPATGRRLASVAQADAADADKAVAAARRAFHDWSVTSGRVRERILRDAATLVREHREGIAQVEALDAGKLLAGAQADIDEVAFQLDYFAGWATKISGETMSADPNSMSLLVREPVGVAALISPWNFPLLLANQKVAPALAAGCTVILKPAEQTPLSALVLAAILQEAGLSSGVFNLLTGFGPEAGGPLVAHPDVDKVSFTGSTEVGKHIVRESAGTMKRLSMELGGKSPGIVFADADFDAMIDGTAKGIFWNQGQVCAATSRLFVESSIHDDVVEALSARAASFTLGHGLDPSTTMGPVVSEEQRARVAHYVTVATDEGAKVAGRGTMPSDSELKSGSFHEPIILSGVRNEMRVAQEEIFGPLLSIIKFDTADQAIELANDTKYGLAASVWTQDINKAFKVARSVRAGSMWINDALQAPSEGMFGGFKESGFGRELGKLGLDESLEYKHIFVRLPETPA